MNYNFATKKGQSIVADRLPQDIPFCLGAVPTAFQRFLFKEYVVNGNCNRRTFKYRRNNFVFSHNKHLLLRGNRLSTVERHYTIKNF